jgi:hypothetical protein
MNLNDSEKKNGLRGEGIYWIYVAKVAYLIQIIMTEIFRNEGPSLGNLIATV